MEISHPIANRPKTVSTIPTDDLTQYPLSNFLNTNKIQPPRHTIRCRHFACQTRKSQNVCHDIQYGGLIACNYRRSVDTHRHPESSIRTLQKSLASPFARCVSIAAVCWGLVGAYGHGTHGRLASVLDEGSRGNEVNGDAAG